MTAPSFSDVHPIPRQPRGLGCGMILLVALGVPWLAFLGITGGLVAYALAWSVGTPSVGVSIAAGVVALVIVSLAIPLGVSAGLLLMPGDDHPLLETALSLAAPLLLVFLRWWEVLFFAVPAGIAAGLAFHWCQPLYASILLGVLSPLGGLTLGVLMSLHTTGDSDGGGDSAGGGWGEGGGDGGDGGDGGGGE